MPALIIGIVVAIYVIARFKKNRLEKGKLAYPLLLATFPVYYWVFAIYGSDYDALLAEALIGVLFIGISLAAYQSQRKVSLILLGFGYIGHAIYDAVHDSLFINAGTPTWWPEFCGAVDILIGIYIVYLATTTQPRVSSKDIA